MIVICAIFLVGCKGGGSGKATAFTPRAFPALPEPPSVISDPQEKTEYVVSNYWNEFLEKTYPCDSNIVNGVTADEVEKALGTYVTLLEKACPIDFGRKAMASFFDKVEQFEAADTSSNVFEFFERMIPKYLYDPNSPMRNEDLYLPFVQKLSSSEFTPQNMRRAYSHDAAMCSMNRFGEKVPDFRFRTLKGRDLRLYSVKAEYTMLFFSNPGCHACQGIISEVMSRPYISEYLANGTLAVVNVYIDDDVDAWKQYAVNYPESWYSGYDPDYVIREDLLYNVRAIPSLYLLDREKRVIMKDAPTENVLNYLDRIAKQTIQ